MTTPTPGGTSPLVAGPLELNGLELAVDAPNGRRTHPLTGDQAHVLATLMRRADELVGYHELQGRGQERLAVEAVRAAGNRLPALLPDWPGVLVDLRAEVAGLRLLVDVPARRETVGHLGLHPAGSRCWIGDTYATIPDRLLPLLRMLVRADAATVTDADLCRALGFEISTLRVRISELRRALTTASGESVGVFHHADRYELVADDPSCRVTFETFAFNFAAPWCWMGKRRVMLTAAERAMLRLLVQRPNEVVALADLWAATGPEPGEAHGLRQSTMWRFCKKIAVQSREQLELVRVDDRGYVLRATVLRLGPLELDTREETVKLAGRPASLSRRFIPLLAVLLRHAVDEPAAATDLLARVPDDAPAGERDLHRLATALREQSRGAVRLTRTVDGRLHLVAQSAA